MRKTVTLAGGASEAVSFELVALDSRLAHVALKTNLPGAQLLANGEPVATTPITTTLTFAPGHYRFELARPGYTTAAKELDLGEGATGEVHLEPQLDERSLSDAANASTLELEPSEPGASVVVDGKLLGVVHHVRLPPGPHSVKVEKGGFTPYERTVSLSADKPFKLSPYLVPTPETRADYVAAATRTRTLGLALGLGGGAVLATSTVMAVVFSSQRSDRQVTYDATVARAEELRVSGQCGDVCIAEFDEADANLKDAKLRQTLSFVGIGVGAVATAAGIYFLVSGDDPKKYDHPPKSSSLRVRPTWNVFATGATGGLTGSF